MSLTYFCVLFLWPPQRLIGLMLNSSFRLCMSGFRYDWSVSMTCWILHILYFIPKILNLLGWVMCSYFILLKGLFLSICVSWSWSYPFHSFRVNHTHVFNTHTHTHTHTHTPRKSALGKWCWWKKWAVRGGKEGSIIRYRNDLGTG